MPHVVVDVTRPGMFSFDFDLLPGQVGGSDPQYYEGMKYQRGFGIGQHYLHRRVQYGHGAIGSLAMRGWRSLLPWLEKAGKFVAPYARDMFSALTQEGVETGSRVLDNVARGQKLGAAFETEGTQALKNLAKRAGTRLTQAGSGIKTRPATRRRSVSNLHIVGRSVRESTAKRRRRNQNDLVGLY